MLRIRLILKFKKWFESASLVYCVSEIEVTELQRGRGWIAYFAKGGGAKKIAPKIVEKIKPKKTIFIILMLRNVNIINLEKIQIEII